MENAWTKYVQSCGNPVKGGSSGVRLFIKGSVVCGTIYVLCAPKDIFNLIKKSKGLFPLLGFYLSLKGKGIKTTINQTNITLQLLYQICLLLITYMYQSFNAHSSKSSFSNGV